MTPAPFDVRTRVHEYGGGSYVVAGGTVVFSHLADGRLYRVDPGDDTPVPITPEGPFRYGDLRVDAARRRFVAVREEHVADGQPRRGDRRRPARRGPRAGRPGRGARFPGLAADRHPTGPRSRGSSGTTPTCLGMPTRLRVAPMAADGTVGTSDLAAGGPEESIVQPEWSPDGVLHLVSDRSGWWNLYRVLDGPRLEPLAPMDAEFADPAWIFDRSSYGFLADGSISASPDRPATTGSSTS